MEPGRRRFERLSIRSQLAWLAGLASGIALLLACAAFLAHETFTFRGSMVQFLTTRAEILAYNSTSALLFRDPDVATEALAGLRFDPRIRSAGILARDGELFAHYRRETDGDVVPPPEAPPGGIGHRFAHGALLLFRPIVSEGERIGTVYLESDLVEFEARIRRYATIAGAVLVLALVAGTVLSFQLQRIIARPILRLVETMGVVTAKRSYSVRADVQAGGELGLLVEGFNEMLGEIERRDEELRRARDELEARVAERTHDLKVENRERRQAEERFRSLLGSAPDAMVITDRSGRIVMVNARTTELFGYEESELLGEEVERLIPKRFRGRHPAHRESYYEDPQVRPMGIGLDLYGLRRDGSQFPVEISLSPIRTDQGLLVTAAIRDVTERREAELELERRARELARSNAELEQFAYVASHDLQEPLRMVGSYTQLLARRYKGRLDESADEFINYAVDGVTRMQGLINDLLAYSRVGTRGKPFVDVDLGLVLDKALGNLGAAIEAEKAEVDREPLPTVVGDPTQMLQLFQNLIANAIKFHGEEAPHVRVSATREDHGWVISFADRGIGIEPEYLDRIFVIFQRLHGRGEYPGTGIGLAICKKIVERHGGRIWVESEVGKGSTFCFSIPDSPARPDASEGEVEP